eukprot:1121224-Prymnesium_polylepis.1
MISVTPSTSGSAPSRYCSSHARFTRHAYDARMDIDYDEDQGNPARPECIISIARTLSRTVH